MGKEQRNIKVIVLTGGPCGGKTTALNRIVEKFTKIGYKVFTLPEVPTIFTAAGMDYLTSNKQFFYEGEKATLKTQLGLEDCFHSIASTITERPCLIICDRGTLDISTYLTPEVWESITSELGVSGDMLLKRYDAVIHLVTAAKGAEEHYTVANNAQRLEQPNEEGFRIARMLDDKAIEAWKSHEEHHIVSNDGDFEYKMQSVLNIIDSLLSCEENK